MEALILLLVLAMGGKKAEVSPPPQTSGAGSAPPTPAPAPDVGGAVKSVLGVAGSVVTAVAGAVGGGGAAAGTAGTVAAAGGTTAGTTAGGAAGGAGVTAGTATSAIEIAGAAALGSAVAGVGIIVGVMVAYLIADRIVKAQELDKDWQGRALGLNINAWALSSFEAKCVEAIIRGRSYTVVGARDVRFDRVYAGQKIALRGERPVYRFIPLPGEERIFRRIRMMGLEFLRLRSAYGYRLIRAWGILPRVPANWGMTEDMLRKEYEQLLPGIGSLLDLPHAAGGATVVPRGDYADPNAPPLEQIASASLVTPDSEPLTPAERGLCNMAAMIDVCSILRWDPRPGIADDPAKYADMVCDALQWNGNTVPGLELRGETLWFDPAFFGPGGTINPAAIRRGSTKRDAFDVLGNGGNNVGLK